MSRFPMPRMYWIAVDRSGRLWQDGGQGRAALELFIAEHDAKALGHMPACSVPMHATAIPPVDAKPIPPRA